MAKKNTKLTVGAGVIAAGAAAAAAGYYFYASTNAKQNRKVAAKWATSLKQDVLKQAKKLKDMDKKQMISIIDTAASTYSSVKNLDRKDLDRAAKELKNNWQELVAELQGVKGTVRARALKAVKKAVKKSATKKSR